MKGVMSELDDVPPVVSDKGFVYTTGVKKTENSLTLKQVYKSDGTIRTYKQMFKLIFGKVIGKEPKSNYEHMIYAMDIKKGDIICEESLGMGPMVDNNKSGAPILYDDKVFVGSLITRNFYAYNADNGENSGIMKVI